MTFLSYITPHPTSNALSLSAPRHQESVHIDNGAMRTNVRKQCAMQSATGAPRSPVCAAFMSIDPRPQHSRVDPTFPENLRPVLDSFKPPMQSALGTSCDGRVRQ